MFKSVVTGPTYKVRQKITCEAHDAMNWVTCKKHNIQEVGCTTELKKRISNYTEAITIKEIYHVVLQKIFWKKDINLMKIL